MSPMMQIPLNMIVIKTLSEGGLSGYDIMNRIKEETGYWKPSPGTIYPLLEKLEKRGLVTSKADGKKRLYTLTTKAKLFMKVAEAKKVTMAKYAICCFNTYKYLFGDDMTIPLIEESDYLPKFFPEMIDLRNAILSASEQKDAKKIERIRSTIKKTCARIKKISNGVKYE